MAAPRDDQEAISTLGDIGQAIERAKTDGFDARGVTITPSLLEDIFPLLDWTDQDRPIMPNSWFDGATFSGDAWFDGATFSGDAGFNEATFTGDAGFIEATFTGDARFSGVSLSRRLSFQSARPAKRLQVAVRGSSTGEIGPTVDLKEALFGGPAVVSASRGGVVKLVSLEETDATNLTVTELDLSACRFLGAINLDRLRIDGPLRLHGAPGWWRARRRVLREEGALRGWPDWNTPGKDQPDDPTRLQAVYRELRKGREDAKDEPGAADFYYGEMEMRRAAASGWERALLTLYWLVSGYALRASRFAGCLRRRGRGVRGTAVLVGLPAGASA